MDYSKYKIEDFVLDPAFRSWVLNPNTSSNMFWESWIADHPERLTDIRDAREILLSMGRVAYEPTEEMEDDVWQQIAKQTSGLVAEERDVVPLNPTSIISRYPTDESSQSSKLRWLYRGIAASVLLAVAALGYLHLETETEQDQIATIEEYIKENAAGQKSNIMLPDGSKIWLNSESTIRYSSAYNETERRVILDGEAFFDVAEDPSRPFVVETQALNTTALGTSFNVKAYTEEVEVVLFTGKVKVESPEDSLQHVFLMPGEKALLEQGGHLNKEKADLLIEALWKEGIIYFQDTELKKAIGQLERWYGVDIRLGNFPSEEIFLTGRFEDENLLNVLRSLSYSTGFSYDIRDKNVTINF